MVLDLLLQLRRLGQAVAHHHLQCPIQDSPVELDVELVASWNHLASFGTVKPLLRLLLDCERAFRMRF